MVNQKLFLLTCILLTFIGAQPSHCFSNRAEITIKTINEDGQPIQGANIVISFNNNKPGGGTSVDLVKGISNSDGEFAGAASCNGHVAVNITKNGFYKSKGKYDYQSKSVFGWKPNNPTITILLREIENPVPMYSRDTNVSLIEIPEVGKEIGFDLLKFDWVSPYGEGVHNDFIFELNSKINSFADFKFELIVKNENKSDGFISYYEDLESGSIFKLPRYAPENGYDKINVLKIERRKDYYKTSYDENLNYIFRIRTRKEDNGELSGLYGKILGGFNVGTKKEGNAYIKFRYYLNPDFSRNLEFDQDENIFTGLSRREQINITRTH